MTRAGALALLSALLFGATALLFGLPELFLAAVVCAGLVLLAGIAVSVRPPLRAVCNPARRRIQSGTPLEILLRVSNGARHRRVAAAAIFDESHHRPGAVLRLATMLSGAVIEERYLLLTAKRGWRAVGPLTVEVEDPLALARRRHRLLPQGRVLVWPRIDELAALPERIDCASERRRQAQLVGGAATDFHSLRRFEPGDDPHRIHWPSSTRYQELLVRRFETVQRPETLLFLETDEAAASPGTFERMVSAAAGLAVMATAEAGSVRLVTRDASDVRAQGIPTAVLDTLALIGQIPTGTRPAPRLPVGAARMSLLAVTGDGIRDSPPALDLFQGRRIVLRFWHDEPPPEQRDVVDIGPGESTVKRWDEFRALRTGAGAP
ncbi:MAG: DUF58 domain-containing protein [Acidimicrobiia bacterium]|nr:DUF58 domain-containing protein [Acidimicrobiia bacterium]